MIYLSVILVIIILFITLYFFISDTTFLNFITNLNIKLAKMKVKNISTSKGRVEYIEGGNNNTEVLLLLHGITADKNQWPIFAKQFIKKYRVIALDLPPFGNSEIDWNYKYSLKNQAKLLKEIIDKLEISNFHIVGNSMGGGVAAEFVLQNPNLVKSLALFDTMGVYSAKRTDFLNNLESGENNFLLIQNFQDIDKMFEVLFYKSPFTPKKIKREILRLGKENFKINNYIFDNLIEEDYWLENELHKIDIPTLILWGEDDKIFDKSSTEVIEKNIKNTTLVIIEKCGHLPMFERPKATAKAYQNFLIKSIHN